MVKRLGVNTAASCGSCRERLAYVYCSDSDHLGLEAYHIETNTRALALITTYIQSAQCPSGQSTYSMQRAISQELNIERFSILVSFMSGVQEVIQEHFSAMCVESTNSNCLWSS